MGPMLFSLSMDPVPHAQSRRTSEQVDGSAKAAGLTDPCGPTQLLHFSPQVNSEDMKLLELTHDVLEAIHTSQR